jgi:hypothetical protein
VTTFAAQTYQNEFLPVDGSEVNAIVTVTSSGAAAMAGSRTRAEVIVIDVSGSMQHPRSKLKSAVDATTAAIACLPDGTLFGVLAGAEVARRVFPIGDELAVASRQSRAEASHFVRCLQARGGTAIGSWLMGAHAWLRSYPQAIRHVLLLTDGRNESESADDLSQAVLACRDVFQCDCRGVGTDWEVAELRAVSSALLGSVDIVADPKGLKADFEAIMRSALGKGLADVRLRLWTPRGAAVTLVQQVSPTIDDLTNRMVRVDERTVEFPTGAWGDESRDYHVRIEVPPRAVGEEMLAGRVSLVVDGDAQSPALVRAVWTDDVALSTRINPHVAHYTGQAELALAIEEGLEARRVGDDTMATFRLGRAAQLAVESGNDGTLRLLAKVVDVDDAATGTVRLKRDVEAADEMALDSRSTKTVRIPPAS